MGTTRPSGQPGGQPRGQPAGAAEGQAGASAGDQVGGQVGGGQASDQADDLAAVRRWFETLQAHVQAVDFTGARPIFAEDMIAFGTFSDFMTGRDAAERAQWRSVWHHIDAFRFRDDIRAIVSPDRLQAVGMGVFYSTGYHQDRSSYDRPGRTTVVLVRRSTEQPFIAQHTHMSLFRDVPTRSYRDKPEKDAPGTSGAGTADPGKIEPGTGRAGTAEPEAAGPKQA